MEKAGWNYQEGRLMIRVTGRAFASAEAFTDFVIETMARTGQTYAAGRSECLSQIGGRFAERGVETTFAVADEDRTRYGTAAEAYVRSHFPDLFEDGIELLLRMEATAAEVRTQLDDLGDWATGMGQGPYTEERAKSLEEVRDRLRAVLDRILPRTEVRKLTSDEAEAEVREDLGLPARAADAPQT